MVLSKINIQSALNGVRLQDAKIIRATSGIPSIPYGSAAVVSGQFIYLLLHDSNVLTKISSSGKFTQLHPIGEIPRRSGQQGWSFEKKLYFFGGESVVDRMEDQNIPDRHQLHNDVHQYDPATNTFSLIETSGTIPEPRKLFGLARLGEHVFVQGGYGEDPNQMLNDLSVLNMQTKRWTKISEYEYLFPFFATHRHSLMEDIRRLNKFQISNSAYLIKISSTQLLRLDIITKTLQVLNVEKFRSENKIYLSDMLGDESYLPEDCKLIRDVTYFKGRLFLLCLYYTNFLRRNFLVVMHIVRE